MAVARPGDYITAKCRRCNDVTGHVVMLVLEGAIAKVECKACGSVHKYRDTVVVPGKKTAAPSVRHVRAGQTRENAVDVGVPRARTMGMQTPKARAAQKLNAAKLETAWQEAMVRHAADMPVQYSMKTAFEPHTLVEHPTFGRGEVLTIIKPDKVEILFQDGVKTLRCVMEPPA